MVRTTLLLTWRRLLSVLNVNNKDGRRKRRYAVTALAYDSKGRLLSVGQNSYHKTHPLQKRFAERSSNPHRIYLHAEIDALIKARGKQVDRLVVIGYNTNGKLVCTKLCDCCRLAINYFKVPHVEHS